MAARRGRPDRGGARRRGASGSGGSRRCRGHPRLREHAPPPLPDSDARARAASRPLHMAEDALPGVGAHRRRAGVRGRPVRPRRARALGLLHRLRPSLCLPARSRRSRRGRDPRRTGARCAHRRVARLDGPRRVRRRSAARLARRGHRHDSRRHRAAASPRRRGPGADRGRAVLAVLGDDAPDGGVGRARTHGSACSCTHIWPRRSRRMRTAASSSTARRSSTWIGSVGSPTTSGARTASTCRTPM